MNADIPAIEARLAADRDNFADGYADQSIRDREALLAVVKEQAAKLDAVRDLANTRGRCGWRISADEIRAALTTTEETL